MFFLYVRARIWVRWNVFEIWYWRSSIRERGRQRKRIGWTSEVFTIGSSNHSITPFWLDWTEMDQITNNWSCGCRRWVHRNRWRRDRFNGIKKKQLRSFFVFIQTSIETFRFSPLWLFCPVLFICLKVYLFRFVSVSIFHLKFFFEFEKKQLTSWCWREYEIKHTKCPHSAWTVELFNCFHSINFTSSFTFWSTQQQQQHWHTRTYTHRFTPNCCACVNGSSLRLSIFLYWSFVSKNNQHQLQ